MVVTTHSEWFLEQISNLIRRSELPPQDQEGTKSTLKPEHVGAWLFRRKTGFQGLIVQEVTLDPETGLFPTDYGPVSDELYNEGAAIYNSLQERASG